MNKLRIGLHPYTDNLTHPADRRRIVSWAKARNHEIVLNATENVDLVFLSAKSDFLQISKRAKVPVILDLIDGYLGPLNPLTDFARGVAKASLRDHRTYPRTYRSIVREACRRVNLVICSSPEQARTILPFNANIASILDNHDEIPDIKYRRSPIHRKPVLLWEGTPYTLDGLEALIANCEDIVGGINIVTDPAYFKFFGRLLKRDTNNRIRKKFSKLNYKLYEWSVNNLVSSRLSSDLSVIPVNTKNPLQKLKPENRLLIAFKLGIPVLTSSLESYKRVESKVALDFTCDNWTDWPEKILTFVKNMDYGESQVSRGKDYLKEFHSSELLFKKWDEAIFKVLN